MPIKERYAPSLLDRALALAVDAHEGHRSGTGQAYILHPLRVMARVETDTERHQSLGAFDFLKENLATLVRQEGCLSHYRLFPTLNDLAAGAITLRAKVADELGDLWREWSVNLAPFSSTVVTLP